ncbi:MAG: bifunctional 2-polyprenyl-6-hydroxyphenol methylase/3-demethylubiquinol 3-O-methyltransferase UbiG, partial [Pseudomonadota bacterium]|nr:bifunctional 2-polyprenyl-6-hydroxyphenol methylase/3-demethylubiquinol 3-O-methyltransferase UbiG [Pseudomonadota bacterium]
VLNMEVVEHVADVDGFLRASCELVAPGGCMFVATLNRTVKSFGFAIVGAEYVMRWLPRGTHDWRKFLRPSEIATNLRQGGLSVDEFAGLSFDLLRDRWRIGSDLSVNYMSYATRA